MEIMQRVVVHENQHVKCIVHSIRLGGQTRFQHISDSMVSNQTFTNGKLKECANRQRNCRMVWQGLPDTATSFCFSICSPILKIGADYKIGIPILVDFKIGIPILKSVPILDVDPDFKIGNRNVWRDPMTLPNVQSRCLYGRAYSFFCVIL